MGTVLTVEVQNVERVKLKLDKLGASLLDMAKPFAEIGETLTRFYRDEVFLSKGQAIGEPWEPLKESTMRQKHDQGFAQYAGVPLIRTGAMQGAFGFGVAPMSLRIFNEAEYFKYHQSSAPRSSNLPRRVMLKLTEQQKVYAVETIQVTLRERMAE